MKKNDLKKFKLPKESGVYFFKKGKEILYIGKATNLQDRVRSYFSPDVLHTRGSRIVDMVSLADKIDFEKTDTVLEALILEANLIKKYEPKYNVKEKDNKSYNFVCITKEEEPKVVIERGRTLEFSKKSQVTSHKYSEIYGPFPSQEKLKVALRIIRKIFPFKTDKSYGKLYSQIGLEPEKSELKRNIRNIKLFFNGKKKKILEKLEKEMMKKAKELKFEEAGEVKRQIFALKHINDVALIDSPASHKASQDDSVRIEAFDVAHMSGQNSVGVMTVIENGSVKKSEYKKFILRDTKRGDDVGGLREILTRRLKHLEWGSPDLIVVDGGKGQLNVARSVVVSAYSSLTPASPPVTPAKAGAQSLKDKTNKGLGSRLRGNDNLVIPVVSVLKDEKHKPKDILGNKKIAEKHKKEILLVNNEAHRFAINFFRSKQRKNFTK